MSNVSKRLLFFFIAFPFLIYIILFLPYRHHLVFNLFASLAISASALEVGKIFKNRGIPLSLPVCFFLSALGPFSSYFVLEGLTTLDFYPAVVVGLFIVLFSKEIFKKTEQDFKDVLFRLAGYSFVLIYPGFFGSYVTRLSALPHTEVILLVFVGATYLNDSMAWATGVLWGNGNRNILTVSPNKSLVGFLFGFLTSVAVLLLGKFFAPEAFPMHFLLAALMGAVLGLTTILGDLAESALKRSAVVKDSGQIVPGRGGLLDSIDSPLFNAPVFFYLYTFFTAVACS